MLLGGFLASNRLNHLGGQKNYTHVATKRILKKVIEIKRSIGCMVWP
jgi:hypothetical protein